MKATLHHSHEETPTITSFFFVCERPLRYVAGQFIELTIPHSHPDDRGIKRWFTLSSAPGHELVAITTRYSDPASTFKQALWQLQPGEVIDISEPMGDFVLPKDTIKPLVFIAGGIGITPFHSIVQWLIDTKQSRSVQLLHSVHQAEDLVFQDTFAQPFIEKQEVIGQQLTAKTIHKIIGGIDGKQLFISGPEPMTEAIVRQFNKDFGLGQDQLITDYFPGYPA